MDNFEKKLLNLPKPKMGVIADFKIKSKLYCLMLENKFFLSEIKAGLSRFSLHSALTVFLIIIFVFSGTSFYAYASAKVTRDNKLYPLKVAVEGVRKLASITPEAKVKTFEKLSGRRMEEAKVLSGLDSENKITDAHASIKSAINEAIDNFNQAAAAAKTIPDKNMAAIYFDGIKSSGAARIRALNAIEKECAEEDEADLVKEIEKAKQAVLKYAELPSEEKNSELESKSGNEGELNKKENKPIIYNLNINKGKAREMAAGEKKSRSEKKKEVRVALPGKAREIKNEIVQPTAAVLQFERNKTASDDDEDEIAHNTAVSMRVSQEQDEKAQIETEPVQSDTKAAENNGEEKEDKPNDHAITKISSVDNNIEDENDGSDSNKDAYAPHETAPIPMVSPAHTQNIQSEIKNKREEEGAAESEEKRIHESETDGERSHRKADDSERERDPED